MERKGRPGRKGMAALAAQIEAIGVQERAMDEALYALYRLTPDERNLVENGRGRASAFASAA